MGAATAWGCPSESTSDMFELGSPTQLSDGKVHRWLRSRCLKTQSERVMLLMSEGVSYWLCSFDEIASILPLLNTWKWVFGFYLACLLKD